MGKDVIVACDFSSAEDVIELMLAGATAVEVGAANLIDPCACLNIINDLPKVMDKYGINNLTDRIVKIVFNRVIPCCIGRRCVPHNNCYLSW
jgi:dihydroorotate dehydrogenase